MISSPGIGAEPVAGPCLGRGPGPRTPLPLRQQPRGATSVPTFPVAPITVMVMGFSLPAGTGTGTGPLEPLGAWRGPVPRKSRISAAILGCLVFQRESGRCRVRGIRRRGGR